MVIYLWIRTVTARIHAAIQYLHNQNKNAVSLRRIAELETTVAELSDAYEAVLKSVRKLGARARTRANREKRGNGVDLETVPPDEAEKAAYKQRLRAKLREEGRL